MEYKPIPSSLSIMASSLGIFHEHKSPNPFSMPPQAEIFGFKEAQNKANQFHKLLLQSQTLAERVKTRSIIPPLISKGTLRKSERLICHPVVVTQPTKQNKSQRITEFIQEKREIYFIQLIIDKKLEQIQSIQDDIQAQEDNIVNTEKELDADFHRYKIASMKVQEDLTKSRKASEEATHKRLQLSQELKRTTTSVGLIRSEILKNEDTLEQYKSYQQFLNEFVEETSKSIEEYYSSPHYLIDELDKIETDNLFLVMQCERLNNILEHKEKMARQDIAEISSEIEQILLEDRRFTKRIQEPIFQKSLQAERYTIAPETLQANDQVDKELEDINKCVSRTFRKCFNKDSEIPAISMLEQIEAELENQFVAILELDDDYIVRKQNSMMKKHREIAREAKRMRQIQEQQKKIDQALERANRPIKKKQGRPLMPKSAIQKIEHSDESRNKRYLLEQQKQDEFLFGVSYD